MNFDMFLFQDRMYRLFNISNLEKKKKQQHTLQFVFTTHTHTQTELHGTHTPLRISKWAPRKTLIDFCFLKLA